MKILTATLLLMFLFSARADDAATEPYTLTMMPQFLELWRNQDTLDECKARGVELVLSAEIFNGFICEQGRAWIAADEVAVPGPGTAAALAEEGS